MHTEPRSPKKYPYRRTDGTIGETIITPEQQVDIMAGLMDGDSPSSMAEDFGVNVGTVRRYMDEAGIQEMAADKHDELLADTYAHLLRNRMAIAEQRIEKWSGLADDLLKLMAGAIKNWSESDDASLITPTGMSRLLREYRELEKMWLKFVDLDLDVTRSDVRVTKTEQQQLATPLITVDALLDRGLSSDEIAGFIDVIEQSQKRIATVDRPGDRDPETAGPLDNAGQARALTLQKRS